MYPYGFAQGALPCPELDLTLISTTTSQQTTVRAILDSGSAMSAIPEDVLRRIGPGFDYDTVWIVTPAGSEERQTVRFFAKCSLFELIEMEFVSIKRPYALIGRDIMNLYNIEFRGSEKLWLSV